MEPIVGFAMLLEFFSMITLALVGLVIVLFIYAVWKIISILHEANR